MLRWRMGASIAFLLLPWANAQEKASIAGIVIDASTGQPQSWLI